MINFNSCNLMCIISDDQEIFIESRMRSVEHQMEKEKWEVGNEKKKQ